MLTEIGGHHHSEDTGLTSWIKISGLATVRGTRLEVVGHSHRQVEMLFVVAIEVTKHQAATTVGVRIPALERRRYALPRGMGDRRIHQVILSSRQRRQQEGADHHAARSLAHGGSLVPVSHTTFLVDQLFGNAPE